MKSRFKLQLTKIHKIVVKTAAGGGGLQCSPDLLAPSWIKREASSSKGSVIGADVMESSHHLPVLDIALKVSCYTLRGFEIFSTLRVIK